MRSHAKASFVVAAVFGLFAFASLTSFVADAVADSCPNAVIREEQNSGYLPECRAYEQVSPVDKNGTDVATPSFFTQSSTADGTVAFASPGAFAGAQSLQARGNYLARRDPASGWQVKSLDPPQTTGEIEVPGYGLQAYSDDLSASFMKVGDPQPAAGAEAGGANLVVRGNWSDAYRLVTPLAAPYHAAFGYGGVFAGASTDFSHTVFESSSKLNADASIDEPLGGNEMTNLYQHVEGSGASELQLVDLLPDPDGAGPEKEVAAPQGAVAGGIEGSLTIGTGSGATGRTYTQSQNVVSDDGSRVFWTTIAPRGNGERQVYVRINGEETIQVSASQRATPETPQDAIFMYATPDGRYAFFTSFEKLTNDSTAAGSAVEPFPDLYRFDVDTGQLVDLTVDHDAPASVLGVLGASNDGQTVYFAANGNLTPASESVPDADPVEPAFLRPKLYVSDHGQIRYIATLPGRREAESLQGVPNSEANWMWDWLLTGVIRSSHVSANGRYLMFRSSPVKTAAPAANFAQVYRFDDEAEPANALTCASCLPEGAANTSAALLEGDDLDGTKNATAGSIRSPYVANLLLPGGKVLFATAQALSAGDVNNAVDVYLWSAAGGPQLISSGTSPYDSFVGDASPDAKDVYFVTRQRLTGTDTDANLDLYDARVDGGFPEPPASPPPCGGEVCQGTAPVGPTAAGTASAAVYGHGNVAQRRVRCGKNARRITTNGKSRCVRKKHKHTKKHSHKKNKHAKKHKHNRRAATHRNG